MTWILFFALLTAAGTGAPATQEFDDKAACEAARDALQDNWKAPAFCVAKGTEPEDQAPTTPARAPSGGTTVKAPTARK